MFKLKLNWYLESGPAQLVIPRFIVPKLKIEDNVVHVRCVWDCKRNGHNAPLWAPGCMLPNALDAKDQVIKWLDVSFRDYFLNSSHMMDYLRDPAIFIKTQQADIDIGQYFNNFRINPLLKSLRTKVESSCLCYDYLISGPEIDT